MEFHILTMPRRLSIWRTQNDMLCVFAFVYFGCRIFDSLSDSKSFDCLRQEIRHPFSRQRCFLAQRGAGSFDAHGLAPSVQEEVDFRIACGFQ